MTPPAVVVEGGRVSGVLEGETAVFRGLPYAATPVGALRWRAPEPPVAWTGTREATAFGANCLQPANPTDTGIGKGPVSEDCLTLNVWSPAAPSEAKRPVMVWIHGGSFTSGSGSAELYDGRALARRGTVVVTLNYRLGRFGFFAHPALAAESRAQPVVNFALLDQIAALQWVQRNIAAFGGDKHNVTVFGESAGGVAVQHMMLAAPARGLFARAIVQSGRGLEDVMPLAVAENQARSFIDGLAPDADTPAALRAIPAAQIAGATVPSIYDGFGPILDGHLVRSTVWEGFAAGRQARVPLIVGFNSHELPGAFLRDTVRLETLLKLGDDARQAAVAAYGGEAGFKESVFGDALYAVPAIRIAQAHARTGAPTYLYRFGF
ncbi:MAG TPA: carboxylesterase family protein, partial [Rubrivivax sp.]|nr:carboxylesterase family protein [Rubrivivax sp.]